MAIRAECFSSNGEWIESREVSTGSCLGLDLLKGEKVGVSSLEENRGTIFVGEGLRGMVRAFLHKNIKDPVGERVDVAQPIVMQGEQMVSLETKKIRPGKIYFLYSI